jgi:hypothetical protein
MSHAPKPAPPAGFRPASATDEELSRYGFPLRPPQTGDRNAARLWARIFDQDIDFVAPNLRPPLPFASRSREVFGLDDNQSNNWSGVVVANPSSGPLNLGIGATFNVPNIASVSDGTQAIAVWIGLGGAATNAPSLLQAGIAGTLGESGGPVFYAWSEWLSMTDPVGPQPIGNVPTRIGDSIETQIWVTSPTTATVVMQNISIEGAQSAAVILPLTAPAGLTVATDSAEWIVERPLIANNGFATLPAYSAVTFTEAAAWSQSNAIADDVSLRAFAARLGFNAPVSVRQIAASLNFAPPISLREMMRETAVVFASSGQVNMMTEDGVVVSTATITGKDVVQCEYVGVQPGVIKPVG